jgi:hypothetical protein
MRRRMRPANPEGGSDERSRENGCSQYSSYRWDPTGMTKTSIDEVRSQGSAKLEVSQKSTSPFELRTSNFLYDGPPPGDQIDQEQNQGNHEEHVNDPAGHIEGQTEYPEQQQQDDERPQHSGYLPRLDQGQATYHIRAEETQLIRLPDS